MPSESRTYIPSHPQDLPHAFRISQPEEKDDLKPISGNVFSATERQAWGDKAHSHVAPQKVGETSGNKFVVFSLF